MAKAQLFDDLTKSDEFLNWFWSGKNRNNLINFLNTYKHSQHTDKHRREKYQPYAYGLVLNDASSGKNNLDKKFKLMKIGFTQCPIGSNENSRIKEIKRKFKDYHGKDVAVIFVLMKNAVDTESHHAFEVRITKNVGVPYQQKLCQITEWVLTTQGHIDKLKEHKKQQLQEKGQVDASILKLSNFTTFVLS